ncbi:hypothetical protein DFH27DRAFT_638074 [Peziza echinospora]|nr:hypothetical protein DFH27DRAFT_638074 [Peziza echinospora]
MGLTSHTRKTTHSSHPKPNSNALHKSAIVLAIAILSLAVTGGAKTAVYVPASCIMEGKGIGTADGALGMRIVGVHTLDICLGEATRFPIITITETTTTTITATLLYTDEDRVQSWKERKETDWTEQIIPVPPFSGEGDPETEILVLLAARDWIRQEPTRYNCLARALWLMYRPPRVRNRRGGRPSPTPPPGPEDDDEGGDPPPERNDDDEGGDEQDDEGPDEQHDEEAGQDDEGPNEGGAWHSSPEKAVKGCEAAKT